MNKQVFLTIVMAFTLFLTIVCVWGERLDGTAMAAVILLAGILIFKWAQAVVS